MRLQQRLPQAPAMGAPMQLGRPGLQPMPQQPVPMQTINQPSMGQLGPRPVDPRLRIAQMMGQGYGRRAIA
jgi:hypothetical protein